MSSSKVFASANLKVAAIFSTSGIAASHNSAMLEMVKLAVLTINRDGGVMGKQIELIVLDNQSTSIGSALAAQKAVDLDVIAVIGSHWSSHSLAMAPVLQEAGIPMISPASTNPEITRDRDYIFRVCFIDSLQGKAMARFAREDLMAGKAVIVSNLDEQYSLVLARFFKKSFQEREGEILDDLHYRGNATDFSMIITKIKMFNPDVIYLPGYTRDSGLFIKQARKMGVSAIFLGGDAWDEIAALTGSDINGSYQTAAWHPMVANEQSKMLKGLFNKEYGVEIQNYSSPLAYDAVMVLAEALNHCQCTEREEVRDALFSMQAFSGATGEIQFDEHGDPRNKEVIILQFEEKNPIFVKSLHP